MCYFLDIAVPERFAELVESPRGLHIGRHHDPAMVAALGPSFAIFTVEDGGCACKLYTAPRADPAKDRAEAQRQKYKRMGWSEAKIARALADAAAAPDHEREPGLRRDVAELIAALADRVAEVRLFVRHYERARGDEQVRVNAQRTVTAQELRDGLAVDEDVVYVIQP